MGGDGFRMIQAHYIYCTLYFYYYYISSTSDHEALDSGLPGLGFPLWKLTPFGKMEIEQLIAQLMLLLLPCRISIRSSELREGRRAAGGT